MHFVGIVTSLSSSSHFVAAAATHNYPMMSLPGRRGTMTNLASRLPTAEPCADGSNANRDALPILIGKALSIV